MEKPFYKSKGIWGGIIIVISAVYGYLTEDPAGAQALFTVGVGMLGVGIRAAL